MNKLQGMWFAVYDGTIDNRGRGGVFLHGCVESMVSDTSFLAQMLHPDTRKESHWQLFPAASWPSMQFWKTKKDMLSHISKPE